MTPLEAAELFRDIVAAYPNANVSERASEVYETMLADVDARAARAAAARLLATSRFMPTIAEIREAAAELTLGPRRLGGEAWGDVGMAVRRYGRNRTPEFADPLVAEAVRQLGWLSICDSTNDVADRARFIELYDGLAQRERRDTVAGPALALPAPKSGQRQLKPVPAPKLRELP